MRLPSREEIFNRLENFAVFRLLMYERWFRVAFAVLVLGAALLGLALPKIWQVTPGGVTPVIRISGLDQVQAWSLARTAKKLQAEGKPDDSLHAWQVAIANNPGRRAYVDQFLAAFLDAKLPRKYMGAALQQSLWLLRISATNLVALERAGAVFEQTDNHVYLITLLQERKDNLTPKLEGLLLKSLFKAGRFGEFAELWEKIEAALRQDAELILYHDAYLAGWGPLGTVQEAMGRLTAALGNPALRQNAAMLMMTVSASRRDVEMYQRALNDLREDNRDTLMHHIGYWKVLASAGRDKEAADLALAQPVPPISTVEVVELARLFARLGRRSDALDLLRRSLGSFSGATDFWLMYTDQLIIAEEWEELRRIALQIRVHPIVQDALGGYSFYLEGLAEHQLNRPELAEAAFSKLQGWAMEHPQLGFVGAGNLLRLGYASVAKELLRKVESQFEKDAKYWLTLFWAADELKDVDLMLWSSGRAYTLAPQDLIAVNNYAAALLISHHRPEEAVGLTLNLMTRLPGSLATKVNHAAALVQNQRTAEAEAIFRTVNTNLLTRAQFTLFNLDLLELALQKRNLDEAVRLAGAIEEEFLYPPQRAWLKEARQQMSKLAAKE